MPATAPQQPRAWRPALLPLLLLLCGCWARALDNGLGRLPVRGVSSWCVQGHCGWDRCWDAQYRSLADAMVDEGFKAAGYEYALIDDCWVAGRDNTTGELFADPTRFPNGIAPVADYFHSRGLKLGIYTDLTTAPCTHGQYDRENGTVPGSYGHYDQDAATFARWGADMVKADFCNAALPGGGVVDPEQAYPAFSAALNQTGRPIYFLACYDRWLNSTSGQPLPGHRPVWEWIQPFANAYRLSHDHHDDWTQLGAEIETNSQAAAFSRPGSFGDFDALVTGGQGCVGPGPQGEGPPGGGPPGVRCPNMTEAEYRTAFSLWVIAASPLLVDADIRNLTDFQRTTLLHTDMLALHHDPAARGGSRIGAGLCMRTPRSAGGDSGTASGGTSSGSISGEGGGDRGNRSDNACPVQVWRKQLHGNASAVALYNAGDVAVTPGFSLRLLGYGPEHNATRLAVRDVWGGHSLPDSRGGGSVTFPSPVPAHGTVVLHIAEIPASDEARRTAR